MFNEIGLREKGEECCFWLVVSFLQQSRLHCSFWIDRQYKRSNSSVRINLLKLSRRVDVELPYVARYQVLIQQKENLVVKYREAATSRSKKTNRITIRRTNKKKKHIPNGKYNVKTSRRLVFLSKGVYFFARSTRRARKKGERMRKIIIDRIKTGQIFTNM